MIALLCETTARAEGAESDPALLLPAAALLLGTAVLSFAVLRRR